MTAEEPTVDPARCPLCGGDNACAMQAQHRSGQPQPPCWCTRVSFAPDLLARVPEVARGRACLCPRCAAEGAGPRAC
ncbi:cysteine-rich CWC family protein [Tepidimonas aquatica]|uniref:Cysteine-rich CWC n=1 Tax=Tepidimonas aquatica TaxID=247482 RepID=A0A554WRR5_9BURK|nr:cysteine-rich CWC family protein [Tepidimonas aquatica]TSE26271.1 Cysteine-rich CWC [Tepidimonas aquatica]